MSQHEYPRSAVRGRPAPHGRARRSTRACLACVGHKPTRSSPSIHRLLKAAFPVQRTFDHPHRSAHDWPFGNHSANDQTGFRITIGTCKAAVADHPLYRICRMRRQLFIQNFSSHSPVSSSQLPWANWAFALSLSPQFSRNRLASPPKRY